MSTDPQPESSEQSAADPSRATATRPMRWWWPLAVFGAGLGVAEIVFTLSSGFRFFLSPTEMGRYALLAWSSLSLATLCVGGALEIGARVVSSATDATAQRRRMMWSVFGGALAVMAPTLWLLTAGRRVRDLPARPLLVVVVAALAAWTLSHAARVLHRHMTSAASAATHKRVIGGLCALALLALGVNGLVLRRLYPAFHVLLSLISVGTVALSAFLVSRSAPSWGSSTWLPSRVAQHARRRSAVGLWLGTVALSVGVSFVLVNRSPNGRFAVMQSAPITGQWLSLTPSAFSAAPVRSASSAPSTASAVVDTQRAGISLRGQDVLLVTVDALRADRVAAYGGRGLTPNIDQLARESVVFKRAYTPTPHTSYALSSVLTGKFMRPVLDLPNASTDHRTLPEMLRRYGYRTAAFFPPAVFFVDAERFAQLAKEDFGFEYRKVMFASAQDRVTQLERYLAQAEAGHPLFVWVHLFEPHEPYAPAPKFARGDSAAERYDGEVAQADDGVGGLVRAFRKARPQSTVIVTADHGEELDDHGGRFHGTTLFDEQVRVPLVWSSPQLGHRVIESPVETVDLATTLLAAFGIPRDARMRGDNLAVLLASPDEQAGPRYAFADIGDARMVCSATHKLICRADDSDCLLFDLINDPRESRNVASEQPQRVDELRAQLSELVGSIPKVEAIALADGVGWPEALARGQLGDRTVGPQLVPLLGADKSAWRAVAARICGEIGYVTARGEIDQLRGHDADGQVRAEAAIAALSLGEAAAKADVVAIAQDTARDFDLRLRAALLLAKHSDPAGVPVLIDAATDDSRAEQPRTAAVEALGTLRALSATEALIALLDDVRLRPVVATALGAIGGSKAKAALLAALAVERYPAARSAEARALIALKEPRVRRSIERFLGTDTSLPGGVLMLSALGALSPPSVRGALLTQANTWRGDRFACGTTACAAKREGVSPSALVSAVLQVPVAKPGARLRATFALDVTQPEARVRFDTNEPLEISPGAQQVSVAFESTTRTHALDIAMTQGVAIVAVALVPDVADVPPPPPEPFEAVDAGVDASQ